ncbi:MAG: hypothetical protein ACTSX2_05360 [Candidatus Thorarchaeota archaeon]
MGSSKIDKTGRASIVKEVADYLSLKRGDHILFYLDERGNVVIKKA